MGVEGNLEYFSELLSKFKKPKKLKQLKTVSLKVRTCQEGHLFNESMAALCPAGGFMMQLLHSIGVKSVDVDLKQQKVTVNGYVEGSKVLKKVQQDTKKKAELWPYVPYNMVAHPYIAPAYDKKAPPNFVRSVDPSQNIYESTVVDVQYVTMFSDENHEACSIM